MKKRPASEGPSVPLEKIRLFSLGSVQMRTFHITWLMFFVCFFGWFGLAPLMPTIRADLGLSKSQVGNTIIAAISSTIFARLLIGRLCDVFGPRRTAVGLLLIGSIPVFLVGLARDYTTFLLFRLAIGVIGASFVVTQFHTSLMFAPRVKGTANALTAGWGNLGGGITNMVMPLIFAAIVGWGYTPSIAWRYAMIVPGSMMWGIAWLYYRYTQDTPAGNFAKGGWSRFAEASGQPAGSGGRKWWSVLADWRVGALMLAYAMCFGMEITFDNVASLYFVDSFKLSQRAAGLWAGVFGGMNVFARALGGVAADRAGRRWGMRGKAYLLSVMLLLEGIGLIAFGGAAGLLPAVLAMLFFALFLKMANGIVYAIVPFIDEKNVGLISGFVAAGGNVGGVLFGFLFRHESLSYTEIFICIGVIVTVVAILIGFTRFQKRPAIVVPL